MRESQGGARKASNGQRRRRSADHDDAASGAPQTTSSSAARRQTTGPRASASSPATAAAAAVCGTMQLFRVFAVTVVVTILLVNLQFSLQEHHESLAPNRRHHDNLRLQGGWDVNQFLHRASRQTTVVVVGSSNTGGGSSNGGDSAAPLLKKRNRNSGGVRHKRQINLFIGPEPDEEHTGRVAQNAGDDEQNAVSSNSNDGENGGDDDDEPAVDNRDAETLQTMLRNTTLRQEITAIFHQPAPWRTSSVLPAWMKDYIAWHQEQRSLMTAENWDKNYQFRYLIVRCINEDPKCGGTADRLKVCNKRNRRVRRTEEEKSSTTQRRLVAQFFSAFLTCRFVVR